MKDNRGNQESYKQSPEVRQGFVDKRLVNEQKLHIVDNVDGSAIFIPK